jgi:hypothetical protein
MAGLVPDMTMKVTPKANRVTGKFDATEYPHAVI